MVHRSSPAPFLMKTYQLVDDPITDEMISWNASGNGFVVWKTADFAISTTSSFFISPNFLFNSKSSSSQSKSTSVRFGRAPIPAAYATAERTETKTIRSFRNTTPSSLYEVLGVRIGADTQEVKTAYRRLARVLHPDVGKSDSSADEFMKVHSAYVTLSDPIKRADYDRTLVQRRAGFPSPVSFSGGYGSRRWETDQCW